ncbi:unnamed protein product, partial [Prorocentrum cordatum]
AAVALRLRARRRGIRGAGARGAGARGRDALAGPLVRRRAREDPLDPPRVDLAERQSEEIPFLVETDLEPAEIVKLDRANEWPDVLATRKRKPSLASEPWDGQKPAYFKGGSSKSKEILAAKRLIATFLRMRDANRLIRMGMTTDPEIDARGWCCVALIKLERYEDAARLAAGPDGQSPIGWTTLRYVVQNLAKAGALEAAMHLSRLQAKSGRTKFITAGSRALQNGVEALALYLQSTSAGMPKLLTAHGTQCSLELERMLEFKNDILAITPHRRFKMFTAAFNQLIRWYGRARLVPQALRACEIMNELGIPRDEMTIHFLSRGCAQQLVNLKIAKRYTQVPPDWPGRRPEVFFMGRVNSGKSSMINALFASLTNDAKVNKQKGNTPGLNFFEVNRERFGLPQFSIVDSPGLGTAYKPSSSLKHFPELIFSYLRNRQSLTHVFHLVDVRMKRLLPADKTLIHLLASAARPRVRYTIVVNKIDIVTRKQANATAMAIKTELAPYADVDIMFSSARTKRGVDQMWAKIWQSVTETPRGRKHKLLGPNELLKLRNTMADYDGEGVPKEATSEDTLADLLDLEEAPPVEASSLVDFGDASAQEEGAAPKVSKKKIPGAYADDWDADQLPDDFYMDEEEPDLQEEVFEQGWASQQAVISRQPQEEDFQATEEAPGPGAGR